MKECLRYEYRDGPVNDPEQAADHFFPAYREGKLEQRGTYRYVPNAMYSVVLLGLYHAGLVWFSSLGLVIAAAHHAFVWVHYLCTEKPDMRAIYGTGR